DQLKQRDQSLRKQEQEMDSLSFRNQQLAKRVELLQEELAASEVRSKKGKFYEADEQHRKKEAELRARLEKLEGDTEEHQAVVDGLKTKYVETIERLQSDKARLETMILKNVDCYLIILLVPVCSQQQLRRCQSELNRQVKQSSSVIQEKVPFNDTKLSDYNSLNVPSHNRRHQLKARDVTNQALSFIQDLVAALLNFHTYTEQRVHIYPLDSSIEPISPLNQKAGLVASVDNICLFYNVCRVSQVFGRMPCHRAAPQLSSPSWQLACTVFMMPLKARPQSVPYREALSNRRILTSSTESREGLTQQVGDEESREELIKTHYMARVGELTTQLQISDSKAVHFHSEVKFLVEITDLLVPHCLYFILSDIMCLMQDELTTTKRSYEDQLSMMSDHLCSMNETLSKQREEIDTLKLGGKVLR
ncbi:hypothetical protein XENOCAPTIV_031012, partial [Xenoophorus captivus]